jgi:hypothetical protein
MIKTIGGLGCCKSRSATGLPFHEASECQRRNVLWADCTHAHPVPRNALCRPTTGGYGYAPAPLRRRRSLGRLSHSNGLVVRRARNARRETDSAAGVGYARVGTRNRLQHNYFQSLANDGASLGPELDTWGRCRQFRELGSGDDGIPQSVGRANEPKCTANGVSRSPERDPAPAMVGRAGIALAASSASVAGPCFPCTRPLAISGQSSPNWPGSGSPRRAALRPAETR